MLFRKDMEPRCGYCRFSAPAEEGIVICRKRGLMPETNYCRKFRYDPLRRTPPKPTAPDFSKYDKKDFTL